jgi:hypothetical protein
MPRLVDSRKEAWRVDQEGCGVIVHNRTAGKAPLEHAQ